MELMPRRPDKLPAFSKDGPVTREIIFRKVKPVKSSWGISVLLSACRVTGYVISMGRRVGHGRAKNTTFAIVIV